MNVCIQQGELEKGKTKNEEKNEDKRDEFEK